MPGVAET
ncbi:hypothetical protein D018_1929, partial [Vibrio parahaemolyticus VP2007-007]